MTDLATSRQIFSLLSFKSTTLQHYNQEKPSFGEEVYLNFNLPAMILCRSTQLRVNCLPITEISNVEKQLNTNRPD